MCYHAARNILSIFLLLLPQCSAWLTASDGYNIGVVLGSILGAVLLIFLVFLLIYYCWLRQLLFDYREHQAIYKRGGRSGGYPSAFGTGFYKKKPPPPDYSSRSYERSSPLPVSKPSPTVRSVEYGAAYPSGVPIRSESPGGAAVVYDRSATVRLSPSPPPLAALRLESPPPPSAGAGTVIQVRDGSPVRRQYAVTRLSASPPPAIRGPSRSAPSAGDFDSSFESRQSPLHRPYSTGVVPASQQEYSGDAPKSAVYMITSRPDSAMSSHSRVLVNDPSAGPSVTASGGPSINYQATFKQRVVTSKGQRPAYTGSAV